MVEGWNPSCSPASQGSCSNGRRSGGRQRDVWRKTTGCLAEGLVLVSLCWQNGSRLLSMVVLRRFTTRPLQTKEKRCLLNCKRVI